MRRPFGCVPSEGRRVECAFASEFSMDIATLLGLVAGGIVLSTLILMGGDFRMFYDIHAVIIIFGGSFAATLIRFPLSAILHGLPLGAKFAFTLSNLSARDLVELLLGQFAVVPAFFLRRSCPVLSHPTCAQRSTP